MADLEEAKIISGVDAAAIFAPFPLSQSERSKAVCCSTSEVKFKFNQEKNNGVCEGD